MSEESPDLKPMASPVNDMRNLKTNGSASADELLSWLSKMRGKSPQEVLGVVASSGLFKSYIVAAILMSVLILAWTAISWSYQEFRGDKVQETSAAEVKATPETKPKPIPENIANPDKAEMPKLDINDKQKIADDLGIGETRDAPKNSNPLDDTDDDLLDGLE